MKGGYAAAHGGKALPYRERDLVIYSARLSLAERIYEGSAGKPEAFRNVRRHSRVCQNRER